MDRESTLQKEIERIRKELNEAAIQDISSVECFRLSLKLDRLLEQYYESGGTLLL